MVLFSDQMQCCHLSESKAHIDLADFSIDHSDVMSSWISTRVRPKSIPVSDLDSLAKLKHGG